MKNRILAICCVLLLGTMFVGCDGSQSENRKRTGFAIEGAEVVAKADSIEFSQIENYDISLNKNIDYYEISLDEKTWQEELSFGGLTPNTEYNVFVRRRETNVSNPGAALKKTAKTLKFEQTTPLASYTQADKTISFKENSDLEYSFDGGITYKAEHENTYVENGEKTIKVRYKETNEKYKSDEQEIKVNISNFYLGDGTVADPYQIKTLEHFSAIVNDKHYKLISDINFSTAPIESPATIESFDGNGYKLINPIITLLNRGGGVFNYVDIVRNLTVENAKLTYTSGGGLRSRIGLIAGTARIVDNCTASGEMVLENTDSCGYVGGLVGRMMCYPNEWDSGFYIKDSFADVNIQFRVKDLPPYSSSFLYVGGLFGTAADNAAFPIMVSNSGVNLKCDIAGIVTAIVGGIASEMIGNVENCYSTGDIAIGGSQAGTITMGGIAGKITLGNVSDSYAAMNLGADGTKKNVFAGGIAGIMATSAPRTINNCFFAGNIGVTTNGDKTVMRNSVATGGLINYTVNNCYHSDNLTLPISTSSTTAESEETMKTIAWQRDTLLFSADIWDFADGEYPTLKKV